MRKGACGQERSGDARPWSFGKLPGNTQASVFWTGAQHMKAVSRPMADPQHSKAPLSRRGFLSSPVVVRWGWSFVCFRRCGGVALAGARGSVPGSVICRRRRRLWSARGAGEAGDAGGCHLGAGGRDTRPVFDASSGLVLVHRSSMTGEVCLQHTFSFKTSRGTWGDYPRLW